MQTRDKRFGFLIIACALYCFLAGAAIARLKWQAGPPPPPRPLSTSGVVHPGPSGRFSIHQLCGDRQIHLQFKAMDADGKSVDGLRIEFEKSEEMRDFRVTDPTARFNTVLTLGDDLIYRDDSGNVVPDERVGDIIRQVEIRSRALYSKGK